MSAPFGNQNALKFSTPESRQELMKSYCEHIKRGYSDESFLLCDMQTFKKYLEVFGIEFDTDIIEQAKRERLLFWEKVGISGTVGQLKGFNSRSWEFNMANRFSWRNRNDFTTDNEKIETPIIYIPDEVD